MLKNTIWNRIAVKRIAQALGELNSEVLFVGGAVVSLYVDDPAADDVRPTKDVDIILEILNFTELEKVRLKLFELNFHQAHEDKVMCRFTYDILKVDVMSTKAIGWAPTNPWFKPGLVHAIKQKVEGEEISCLSLPYYLASKFVAYYDRGKTDPRTSKDYEDIVYLLNHVTNWDEQVNAAPEDVKSYLLKCFVDMLTDKKLQEGIIAHMFHEDQVVRVNRINDKLKKLTAK